jgi:hypothetical protein
MKKQILLFASFAVASLSFAQNKVSVGVKLGAVNSTIKGDAASSLKDLLSFSDGAISTGSRTGYFAGVSANIPINEMFSVEPSVNYTQKGYELKGALNVKGAEFLGINAKASLNSSYIDVPVVLKANINGLQIFAGPQVSYLAKADLKTTAGALGFNIVNSSMDATQQLNRWDAGVTGGVGYQFSNGLNISASYDHGLSKMDANKNMEAYNRAFKVGLGFKF